jgi:hypothetical protein
MTISLHEIRLLEPVRAKIYTPREFFSHKGLRYFPTRGFGDVCLEDKNWFVTLGTGEKDLMSMR